MRLAWFLVFLLAGAEAIRVTKNSVPPQEAQSFLELKTSTPTLVHIISAGNMLDERELSAQCVLVGFMLFALGTWVFFCQPEEGLVPLSLSQSPFGERIFYLFGLTKERTLPRCAILSNLATKGTFPRFLLSYGMSILYMLLGLSVFNRGLTFSLSSSTGLVIDDRTINNIMFCSDNYGSACNAVVRVSNDALVYEYSALPVPVNQHLCIYGSWAATNTAVERPSVRVVFPVPSSTANSSFVRESPKQKALTDLRCTTSFTPQYSGNTFGIQLTNWMMPTLPVLPAVSAFAAWDKSLHVSQEAACQLHPPIRMWVSSPSLNAMQLLLIAPQGCGRFWKTSKFAGEMSQVSVAIPATDYFA